jgi:NAD(P)H-dependent flavin oxidoreductase YrpB (nitropropane dioxygenase family)
MPGRAIKNKFIQQLMNGNTFSPKKCLNCLKKCNPAEIPYCITERLINAARGDVEHGLLFCGAKGYMQDKITTVHEVIEMLLK